MVVLQVVVKIHQGILDEVKIYTSEEEAKADFEKYTGVTFAEYSRRLGEHESSDEILGDTEGTEILEIDFREGLFVSETDTVDELRDELEREPNAEEIVKFKAYLDVDIGQWLHDNARCFVRDQLEPPEHDATDDIPTYEEKKADYESRPQQGEPPDI